MCRTRRIKCDETKPTCNQCAKSRRVCPGYKDDFDLVFRNETQATERRARRALNTKRTAAQITFAAQRASSSSSPSKDERDPGRSPTLIAPNPGQDASRAVVPTGSLTAISIPLEQQAPCFFVSNFVVAPKLQSRGYFDFLLPMLRNESPNSHLSLAFSAVAMASLANRPNTRGRRQLFGQAVGQYTKALKATNVALQNSVHQKSDQTLAAILMLGFYETIASEKTSAMAWYSHIEGAVQLVKMRGKKQMRTKTGYSLFVAVRQQMVVSVLSGSKPLANGTEWWTPDMGRDEVGMFVTMIGCRVAEMRSELNHALSTFPRTPEYMEQLTNLMRRAQDLERECVDWEARLPEEWRPRTVAWVDHILEGDITKAEVFPGRVDMYTDVTIANIWNQFRIARLFISGAVVRCAAWICAPVDYRTTPEYAHAVRLCGDLVTDVIAGTPYLLGWRVGQSGILRSQNFSSWSEESGASTAKAIGGFFVMWPLFSISNTDYVSDSQRVWAKARLLYVSEILGLNHAKVLSNFHLRLPSMIIRRDMMMNVAPTQQTLVVGCTRGFSPPVATNASQHITTSTISKLATANGFDDDDNNTSTIQSDHVTNIPTVNHTHAQIFEPASQDLPPRTSYTHTNPNDSQSYTTTSTHMDLTPSTSGLPLYALNPLQQREAVIKENWENERRSLLKKASNQQGDSVERLLANYFVV
ncbi:hypothetical protein BUE80_DR003039 [Diplocarpon rosae]|nr:hypothetical protein BUE80_DR003039 [Diplocarpon rosae]